MEVLGKDAKVCQRCDLAGTRTHVVFGEGNPESRLVFIGEAPGANEDTCGRPFVGRAGMLLEECLSEAGLTRNDLYITSILKCRPSIAENGRRRNRPPSKEESATCVAWMKQQLEIIDPLVIVCLGAVAAKYIINPKFQMTKERGAWFPTQHGRCAIAALHPAYVIRQMRQGIPASRDTLVQDLAEAKKRVEKLRLQIG